MDDESPIRRDAMIKGFCTAAAAILTLAACGAQEPNGGPSSGREPDEHEVAPGFVQQSAGGLRFSVPEEWTEHTGDTTTEEVPADWDAAYNVEDHHGKLVVDFGVHSQFMDGQSVQLASHGFNNLLLAEVGDVEDYRSREFEMSGAFENEAARAEYWFSFTDDQGESRRVNGIHVVVRTGEDSYTGVRINGLEGEVPEETLEEVAASIEPE
ncbi:hypothetical protein [Nocardiopsis suaedae]|uniref:DUF1795 domain-containing protein n=1 Tax=Nocardiopsis suaedae TaxID=3018444 RepID=A0ABT4TV13_9ACTN|nr:hypothetical protein [Nocardiopsis suaedae]MDA2808555.1 hypothetical protein [Nocardiopsis suaedae]